MAIKVGYATIQIVSTVNKMPMKVRKLIEKLQELDQEKEIHLLYDCCYDVEIEIEQVSVDDVSADMYPVGDYVIKA